MRLERGADHPPATLVLRRDGAAERLTAPNGTRIEFVPAHPPMEMPELRPRFLVTRAADAAWHAGRAGMAYRDLIPDRLGGRFIASHIRIHAGGPVPDYVHYHAVRFQMIYCRPAGCASSTRTRASRSRCGRATACCSRRASATACSSARRNSR